MFGRHMNKAVKLEMPKGGLLEGATIEIASDVDNPFIGERGAVAVRLILYKLDHDGCLLILIVIRKVFSAQKGATEDIKKHLEEGMKRLARIYSESFPLALDVSHMAGAGSAGGLTGGIVAATGAQIKRVRLI